VLEAGSIRTGYFGDEMCGRSSLHDAPVSVLESFGLPPIIPGFQPRYNIAPSQEQLTLSLTMDGAIEAHPRRWGLVPYWATDETIGQRLINARAESLTEKAAFSWSFQHRRCLVVADGYYEWRREGKRKVPVFFHLAGHAPFTMAGLAERWTRGPAPLETCVIITTNASERAAEVHDRMPAILPIERARRWLSKDASEDELLEMLSPYGGDDLDSYDVGSTVNNPANDSPDCIRRVDPHDQAQKKPASDDVLSLFAE
jgi:putative SOS response-associated peptidase YedK